MIYYKSFHSIQKSCNSIVWYVRDKLWHIRWYFFFFYAGVLGKKCFYSNGSDLFGSVGNNEMPNIPFPNITESASNVVPSMDNKRQTQSWTANPLFHIDQIHTNFSVRKGTAQVASQTPALKTSHTDERILTKAPAGNAWSSASIEEETLWPTDTSIKISSVPMPKPTSPSFLQGVDLKKSKFILM